MSKYKLLLPVDCHSIVHKRDIVVRDVTVIFASLQWFKVFK